MGGGVTRLQEKWTNWRRAGRNGARGRSGNSHQSYRWAGLSGGGPNTQTGVHILHTQM